ncbi:MAG: hypothetical protein ACRD4R_06345 [Candidatus Acidiferrales bacterium]
MQGTIEAFLAFVRESVSLRGVKIRIVVSAILAAPLAVLSLAIGDVAGLPAAVRYLVSPGFAFGVHAAPSGSWIGDISNALRMAIAGNEVYYAILIFIALSCLKRGSRRSESATNEERDIARQRRAS